MEAEGVPVQLSSWIHKGKNLSVLERRNRMGYARLFCGVSRHLHRKTLSLALSLTSRAYLSTRHAPENKLPPSPEGHISEAEGSSLSLNKTAHSNRWLCSNGPRRSKSWDRITAEANQTQECPPPFAVETKQKETYKYWIAPLLVRNRPPVRKINKYEGWRRSGRLGGGAGGTLSFPVGNSEHLGWGCQKPLQKKKNIKNNNNTEGSLSIRLHFHPCSFIICSFVHGYTNLGPIGVWPFEEKTVEQEVWNLDLFVLFVFPSNVWGEGRWGVGEGKKKEKKEHR